MLNRTISYQFEVHQCILSIMFYMQDFEQFLWLILSYRRMEISNSSATEIGLPIKIGVSHAAKSI